MPILESKTYLEKTEILRIFVRYVVSHLKLRSLMPCRDECIGEHFRLLGERTLKRFQTHVSINKSIHNLLRVARTQSRQDHLDKRPQN